MRAQGPRTYISNRTTPRAGPASRKHGRNSAHPAPEDKPPAINDSERRTGSRCAAGVLAASSAARAEVFNAEASGQASAGLTAFDLDFGQERELPNTPSRHSGADCGETTGETLAAARNSAAKKPASVNTQTDRQMNL